jgi:HAD superfamily hydrolase (TIGR01509 family)
VDGPSALTGELVIFDCDGVLVDSESISNGVLAEMLTEQGLPTTLAGAKATYQGLLLEEVLAGAEARLGRALGAGWLGEYERRRAAVFDAELKPIPGAGELIGALVGAGQAICVASQGRLEKTRRSLLLTGLDAFFEEGARFSAEQVPRGKPHPDLFLFAAASMGFAAAQCVVIEDTPSGVKAARSAGMRVFGYAGETEPAVLEQAGAQVVSRLTELVPLIIGGRGEG